MLAMKRASIVLGLVECASESFPQLMIQLYAIVNHDTDQSTLKCKLHFLRSTKTITGIIYNSIRL